MVALFFVQAVARRTSCSASRSSPPARCSARSPASTTTRCSCRCRRRRPSARCRDSAGASGYVGGIVALVLVVVATTFDWSGMPTDNGLAYRVIALGCARVDGALRLARARVRARGATRAAARAGVVLAQLRRARPATSSRCGASSRPTFWFLLASAVFRDGLAGRVRVRRRDRGRGVPLQLERGPDLRHRREPARGRLDDRRRPLRRPVRPARRHPHGARRPRRSRASSSSSSTTRASSCSGSSASCSASSSDPPRRRRARSSRASPPRVARARSSASTPRPGRAASFLSPLLWATVHRRVRRHRTGASSASCSCSRSASCSWSS